MITRIVRNESISYDVIVDGIKIGTIPESNNLYKDARKFIKEWRKKNINNRIKEPQLTLQGDANVNG